MTSYDAILSIKSHTDGQALRERITAEELWYDHEGPLTLVLVHGYLNDERSAVANYQLFISGLRRIDKGLAAAAMTFTWPSVPSWRDGLEIFRKYDVVARQTGRRLAGFIQRDLRRHHPPRKYVFIAHSLGSRVVIEMIKVLDEQGVDYARHVRIILMAAAVGIEDLSDSALGGEREALEKLPRRHILYSPADEILPNLFKWGMHWSSREAIGLNGQPAGFWTDCVHMHNFGHSDYWPDTRRKVSAFVADVLGFARADPLDADPVATGATLASETIPTL